MTDFQGFAERFQGVKRGVEEIAEIAFSKAERDYLAIKRRIDDICDEREAAVVARSKELSASAWQTWNVYVEALELRRRRLLSALEDAEALVDHHREALRLAHIEQERWKTLVAEGRERIRYEQEAMLSRDADDAASMRFLRGGV